MCISSQFPEYKTRRGIASRFLCFLKGLMLCQEDALKAARNIVQRPAHTEAAEGAALLAAECGGRKARQGSEAHAERAEAVIAGPRSRFPSRCGCRPAAAFWPARCAGG